MQMKYRRRGGFDGRGPIIRPPPTNQSCETHNIHEEAGVSRQNENELSSSRHSTTPSLENDENNNNESEIVSDDTGNPEKTNSVLDPDVLWLVCIYLFHLKYFINITNFIIATLMHRMILIITT